ncbi:MAG: trypsin-like serine protease [Pseudomonadota bacterium]
MKTARCPAVAVMFCVAFLFFGACDEGVDPDPPETLYQSIVNGQLEGGWPAVGALSWVEDELYYGMFCTATLIDPQWVLTAAHCLTPDGDFNPAPATTRFYVGSDAATAPCPGCPPSSGSLYAVDAFYVHPDYETSGDGTISPMDMALVHLSKPILDISPVPPLQGPLGDGFEIFVDASILYVGFGATEGYTQSGVGLKRSTWMDVSGYDELYYLSVYSGTGICNGDSGGPGLIEVNGFWQVIGVNSGGGNDDEYGDPCKGVYSVTRVDVFRQWLESVVGTGCMLDPGLCNCSEACLEDGSCDDSTCEGELEGSCEGFCGGQAPEGCWCDDLCADYGDCCDDIAIQCAQEDPAPADPCEDLDGDGWCGGEGDCDDSDSGSNPDAAEVCGDERDNDCDGTTDEGCVTSPLDPDPSQEPDPDQKPTVGPESSPKPVSKPEPESKQDQGQSEAGVPIDELPDDWFDDGGCSVREGRSECPASLLVLMIVPFLVLIGLRGRFARGPF